VEKCFKESEGFVKASLQSELAPFTQNTHYLHSCKDKWLSRYRDMRAERDQQKLDPDVEKELLSVLAKAGRSGLQAHDLARLDEPDKFETEMVVMAEVRGYFQIAYKVYLVSGIYAWKQTLTIASASLTPYQC
jgi:hypothetical protein